MLLNKHTTKLSLKTISKYMSTNDYTRKKVSCQLFNKDSAQLDILQNKFRNRLNKINNDNIICIDETYFFSNSHASYGWSLKGKRIKKYVSYKRIKYSLLMAITTKGILAYELYDTNIDHKIFHRFIQKISHATKNKYILMDNVSFHKFKSTIDFIQQQKIKPLFIPPYSPQFNSIEYVFSIIKSEYLKQNTGTNTVTLIKSILDKMMNRSFINIYNHVKKK